MTTPTFGSRLRQIRTQRGITQRLLAEQVDCDFTYISKIEHDATPPPSEQMIWRLAEALNTDANELFNVACKVPKITLANATSNPLLTELVHELCERPLPDHTYAYLLAWVRAWGKKEEKPV
jgi:transcriptional regulator with XRE-family HTH domain